MPRFDTDIRPMIERASNLRWVDATPAWPLISQDWAKLSDQSPVAADLRRDTVDLIREVEANLNDFGLRDWQQAALDAYATGNFQHGSEPDRGAADRLTRAALDSTLGQGFYPGIEAGINMTDAGIYATPFEYRFAATVKPGDVTAHMAQPWQADFLKCGSGWWPAQRPAVLLQAEGGEKECLRPNMSHVELVEHAMQLGIATPDGNGGFYEQGRDPALGS